MKKQRKIEKDNRDVAIYARKSRITNKGDSIGVQFKQCADYAKKELGLDEEYEFLQYEDKGLSGYFSDRPDFQRMLHDVQDGKIKAIVCYKLDRVGRKTADLIRLMDFLEMYHVNLLICSNGINTASGLYKIFIQIFAVIAEFERDMIVERTLEGKQIKMENDVDATLGRPKKFKKAQRDMALHLLEKHSYNEVASMTGISRRTLIRYKNENKK